MDQTEARAKLRSHFDQVQTDNYGEGWSALWDKGDFLPWDRLKPSPALPDTLINHSNVVGTALVTTDSGTRRKRALVPGCGRGVDVLLLQSFGYDVVGLEYSESALKACEDFAKQHEAEYSVQDEKIGKGSRTFVHGDFYKNDWLDAAGLNKDSTFDLIYDYTVRVFSFETPPSLCADLSPVLLRHETIHATGLGKTTLTVAG